jgi:hypothetical protein
MQSLSSECPPRLSSYKDDIFLMNIFANKPHRAPIKNKIKFSSYIRKFRGERLQRHTFMRKGFLINKEMPKYLVIYEEAVSHI